MTTTSTPAFYTEVYRTHRNFIIAVVRHHGIGIPGHMLQDVAQEIFADIWEKDGLSKFDLSQSSTENYDRALKAYLASYVRLKTMGWNDRFFRQRRREVAIDEMTREPIWVSPEDEVPTYDLLDLLLAETTGDVRDFILAASQHDSYAEARTFLVEQGWDKSRIMRAVRRARLVTKDLTE